MSFSEICQPVNNRVIGCFVSVWSKQIPHFNKRLAPEKKLAWTTTASCSSPPGILLTKSHLTPSSMVVRATRPHVSIPGAPRLRRELVFIVCVVKMPQRSLYSQHIAEGAHTQECTFTSHCRSSPLWPEAEILSMSAVSWTAVNQVCAEVWRSQSHAYKQPTITLLSG